MNMSNIVKRIAELVAYEAVATGRCLYEIDQDRRLEYECKIRGLYFDFMPLIDKWLSSMNCTKCVDSNPG